MKQSEKQEIVIPEVTRHVRKMEMRKRVKQYMKDKGTFKYGKMMTRKQRHTFWERAEKEYLKELSEIKI